jgi:conjugative transfer signal peptidase TraF
MATCGLFDWIGPTQAAMLRRIVGVVLTTVGLAFAASAAFGIRLNTTMSEPVGLYLRTSDAAAPLVEFCPPEPFAQLSRDRGYRSPGTCPDGAAPLLKAVVARPGDAVELSTSGIAVNGRLLVNTAPRAVDSAGRKLTSWPFVRYVVQPGTVWVASVYHPRSFDSRYFGPIPMTAIRNHLEPLLVLR